MNAFKDRLGVLKRALGPIALLLFWGGCAVFLFALIKLFAYTLPMSGGNYKDSSDTFVGDSAVASYDYGVQLYNTAGRYSPSYSAYDYQYSRNALSKAYQKLLDGNGNVVAGNEALAARIQVLIGNTLFKVEKLQQAAEAYAQALRHEPGNMQAKYNLELVNMKIEAKAKADQQSSGKGRDGQSGTKGQDGKSPGKKRDKGQDGNQPGQQGDGKSKSDSGQGDKGDGKPTGQDPNGQGGKGQGGKGQGQGTPPGKEPGDAGDGSGSGGKEPADSQDTGPIDNFERPGGDAGKGNGKGL